MTVVDRMFVIGLVILMAMGVAFGILLMDSGEVIAVLRSDIEERQQEAEWMRTRSGIGKGMEF